jgi:hypothetical protein
MRPRSNVFAFARIFSRNWFTFTRYAPDGGVWPAIDRAGILGRPIRTPGVRGAGSPRITISLQAAPSFEAFGRFLEATNPFLFWMRFTQMAWKPWLGASAAMLPSRNFGRLPATAEFAGPDSTSHSEGEG